MVIVKLLRKSSTRTNRTQLVVGSREVGGAVATLALPVSASSDFKSLLCPKTPSVSTLYPLSLYPIVSICHVRC